MTKRASKPRKKKMKIWKKIVLVVLGIILICSATVAVWQWNSIKAFYYFMSLDSQERIEEAIKETKKEREKIVSEYVGGTVRDFTEEEEMMIASGQLSVEEATKLIRVDYEKTVKQSETGLKEAELGGQNSAANNTSSKKENIDEFVADNIIKLYSYKAYYLGQLGQIEKSAKKDYMALPAKEKNLTGKQAIVDKYLGKANGLLSECDGKVSSITDEVEKKLKENGMDTSVVGKIKASYEEEKALKKAYYMSLLKG